MTATISTQAATAAVLAAGLTTRLSRPLQVAGVILVPTGPPGPAEAGFDVAGSKACDLRVSLHRDNRARSVLLVIDRDNAPLTGNYVFEADTTVSTYNATAGAPADVDALLTAWAAQIETDLSGYTAVPVPFSGDPTDDDDALLVTAPIDATAPLEYATFALGASCEAPELAALVIWREPDDVSLRAWTKGAVDIQEDYALSWQQTQAQGWVPARDYGVIGGGLDERLDLAARTAVWPELYDFTTAGPDETITIVSSGVGVYGLEWLAVVVVGPQVAP